MLAVWVAGIFILQWRALQRERRDRPAASEPAAGLVKWNIIFGALVCVAIFAGVCVAIFAGVYLFYADVGGNLYPLGDGGPGLPVVLLPAFALVVYGALRTLNLVRELGRSEGPSEDSAEN